MRSILPCIVAMMVLADPAAAQLQVPGSVVDAPPIGRVVGNLTGQTGDALARTQTALEREARAMLRDRERNLARLLRQNPEAIERDAQGELARRGELIATGLTEQQHSLLIAAGFTVIDREEIEGLGFSVTRLRVPEQMALPQAQILAGEVVPGVEFSPDNLHFQSGYLAGASTVLTVAAQASATIATEVGVIDGATGAGVRVLSQRGFATGAPKVSNHGSAVAGLLKSSGASRIRVADVYGEDPAGGNALAISRALGWLTDSGSKIITISLVGPRNAVLQRAIRAAQSRGVVIVAAVGNDGPAAPPAYPASYDNVVAVTGVDRRNRLLIEAGRALHLDYSAPGDQVYAMDARGRTRRWRGTSFATPLVASRIAAALEHSANWRVRVDAEARDLGDPGHDEIFGRGLICGDCGIRN